ncbi:MAG: hypothetical protein HY225_03345 [Candidatus Vogelbacteria bacterium]|nr:hypothetical protein [Candidatus Vogelbacteria bacterium]
MLEKLFGASVKTDEQIHEENQVAADRIDRHSRKAWVAGMVKRALEESALRNLSSSEEYLNLKKITDGDGGKSLEEAVLNIGIGSEDFANPEIRKIADSYKEGVEKLKKEAYSAVRKIRKERAGDFS